MECMVHVKRLSIGVRVRIPLRTKVRIKLGWLFALLALERFTEKAISRLAFDIKVEQHKWKREYVLNSFKESNNVD